MRSCCSELKINTLLDTSNLPRPKQGMVDATSERDYCCGGNNPPCSLPVALVAQARRPKAETVGHEYLPPVRNHGAYCLIKGQTYLQLGNMRTCRLD